MLTKLRNRSGAVIAGWALSALIFQTVFITTLVTRAKVKGYIENPVPKADRNKASKYDKDDHDTDYMRPGQMAR